MKKRFVLGTMLMAVCVLLSGCCLKHDWQEATCTEPSTCAKCDETEGEALGHTWVDATCTAPKTCSVCGETRGHALGHIWVVATCTAPNTCSLCGETEGEALAHTWVDANYQTPKTCSVCGETEGDVLTPSFVEHGLAINAEEGVTYDYVTACYNNPSYTTVGHLTFSGYQTVTDTASLGLEDKEGYEWRTLHVKVLFDDENAWLYGISLKACQENYYDIEGWDDSSREDAANNQAFYTVNYNGIDYQDCTIKAVAQNSGWVDKTVTVDHDWYVRMPIGYDGVVFGYRNSQVEWKEGMYVYDVADENTLFFRMD